MNVDVCRCPARPEQGITSPGALATGSLRDWDLDMGPVEELQALLTSGQTLLPFVSLVDVTTADFKLTASPRLALNY